MACPKTEPSGTSTTDTITPLTSEEAPDWLRPVKRAPGGVLVRVFFAFIGTLLLSNGAWALTSGKGDECRHGEGKVNRIIGPLSIRITPTVDKDALSQPMCHLDVQDQKGQDILSKDDDSFEILLDNHDINGDGIRDLVLLAFSGGAHCCWTYYFLSLGPSPGLITKFLNNREATFLEDEKTGQVYLEIQDGAFDYFDEVCHACSPFPVVFLQLDKSNWVDTSNDHVADYDDIIHKNEKWLTAPQRKLLKALKEKPSDSNKTIERARFYALTIVFAYLYSGREEQARQALRELWPAFDQERIWNLILDTRHNGILCYTRPGAVCAEDADSQ